MLVAPYLRQLALQLLRAIASEAVALATNFKFFNSQLMNT